MGNLLRSIRENNFLIFVIRMVVLYFLWGVCRVVFSLYNSAIIGPIELSDMWGLIHGGFVFDTVSILYINTPFVALSLLPLRIREKRWYGLILIYLYVVANSLALIVNLADICYFPFKLTRIASDDLHFAGEDNFISLLGIFALNYWGVVLLWFAIIAALVWTARFFRYIPFGHREVNLVKYYIGQTLLLGLVGLFVGSGVRGFVAFKGTFPITMSDASSYTRSELSAVVLSNPFCLFRTMGKSTVMLKYMAQERVDSLISTRHEPLDSAAVRLEGQPNIVILILESFGSSNISSLNSAAEHNLTPNLDRVLEQSYLFPNSFHNGIRSMDALPSIWASIPSFKVDFLSLPQSVSSFHPLPAMLKEMGYSTSFFHGGAKETMGFHAFGRASGVDTFYARPEYEKEMGAGDFDGFWGTFDHAFLPYVVRKLNEQPEPFVATIFTVSSHHPYVIPAKLQSQFSHIANDFQRSVAYADYALGLFFEAASTMPWYDNTLFVITADHGSWSDDPVYSRTPQVMQVPIAFFAPGRELRGVDQRVMQHIDIMPTLAGMVGYDKPYFGFGVDIFNTTQEPFAIFHKDGLFSYVVDSTQYRLDDKGFKSKDIYRGVGAQGDMPLASAADSANVVKAQAFLQQYYHHLQQMRYTLR